MLVHSALLVIVLAQPAPVSLGQCIRTALDSHPSLAVVEVGLDAARLEGKAAQATYLPSLTVQSTESYNFQGERETIYINQGSSSVPFGQPASHDDYHSFSIHLRQNLFDGGRYWLRPRRAGFSLERAEQELESSRQGVTLRVIESYFNLAGQRRVLEVLKETKELSLAQLELARERHELGAASRVDVSLARLAAGEDAIAIERQSVSVEQGLVSLNQAMGRTPDEPLEVIPLDQKSDSGLPAGGELPAGAGRDHVALRLNETAQRIADLDVELSATALWPTITGGFTYSRGDREFYKVYSRFDMLYDMGLYLSISYPVFEGFATQSAIETSEVQAERVRRERFRIQHELSSSVSLARRKLLRLNVVQGIEAENVAAAEDSLALARERYRVGDGTALEMRDAQLAVTRSRLARVQTRYDLEITLAQYHHARGDLMRTYLPEEPK